MSFRIKKTSKYINQDNNNQKKDYIDYNNTIDLLNIGSLNSNNLQQKNFYPVFDKGSAVMRPTRNANEDFY